MSMLFSSFRLRSLSACALIAFGGGQALAQQAASDASSTDDTAAADESIALDEVVVTALKRSTGLQKTPISVSALNEQSLKDLGADGIEDYFRNVPNLQVEGDSPDSRRLTLRGVRSSGDATVGLYYDETPVTGPSGTTQDAGSTMADVNLFDVQRVEVLRGPQGTLYGSSSMGGTVRIIFNKPDSHAFSGATEGDYAVTAHGDPSYKVKGMVNVPLIEDQLAARLVLYKTQTGGYVDDVTLDRDNINQVNSEGGRFLVRYTPMDDLTVDASAVFQQTRQDGTGYWYEHVGKYQTDEAAMSPNTDNLKLYNLTAHWNTPIADVTATSSYYTWDLVRTYDYTQILAYSDTNATSCVNYINAIYGSSVDSCSDSQMSEYTAYADSRLPGALYQPMGLKTWTHELRLNGDALGQRLNWTAGIYYEDRSDYIESKVALADATTGDIIQPLDLTAWRNVGTDTQQTAFFGELTYTATDKLTLTAGARRFDYDKTVDGQVLVSNYITRSYAGDPSTADASAKGWVSRFNASYQLTDDVMTYAQAAKGFRPGGANNVPGLETTLVAYDSDSLWNYEAGIKTQWWDHRVTFNTALYQIDWSNMQVSGRSTNGAFSFLSNAGAARIQGVEFEGAVIPVAGLTLSANGAYVDAKLTEDQYNDDVAQQSTTGLKGDHLPYVPHWSGAASAAYNWPIAGSLSGMARVDYTYVGTSHSYFRSSYNTIMGGYSTVNLRTGLEGNDWSADLYVNNVLNDDGISSRYYGFSYYYAQVMSQRPRTVGISVSKRF